MVWGRNSFSHGLVFLLCKTSLEVGNPAIYLKVYILERDSCKDMPGEIYKQVHCNVIRVIKIIGNNRRNLIWKASYRMLAELKTGRWDLGDRQLQGATSIPRNRRHKEEMMSLKPRDQGIRQDLELSRGSSRTTGWTVQLELPERPGAMVGAAQQELDRGGDTATTRDAGQRREKGRNTPLLPSFCPPVYYLCPCWPNLTMKPVGKAAWKTRVQGSAPCDTEVSRKGQGMDLSANRPMTGTRHLPYLTLIFRPFLISTTPCPLVLWSSAMVDYQIFPSCATHIPIL